MTKPRKTEWIQGLALGALICLICALPYASSSLRVGHDALFHILRIEGLAAALKGGAGWPTRVYSLICGGYGYAAGIFYPDIFLLPGAVFRILVQSPELAFKFVMLYTVAATCLTAYFAGRAIGHSHLAGLYLMVLYNLCHYHLGNLFIRSALGECMAMVFVPLVFWGLYDLTEENFSCPWVLCLAFTGLVLTHTISLTICGIAALVWVLIRLPKVLNLKTIGKGLGAVAACLALTAFYWVPMLEQFTSDTFKVTEEPFTHIQYNTLPVECYAEVREFNSPGLWFYIVLLMCVVLLIAQKRKGETVALPFALMLGSVLTVLLPLRGIIPWEKLDETFLSAIQFPWRLFFISQFLLALALSLLLIRVSKMQLIVTIGQLEEVRLQLARVSVALVVCMVIGLADFALTWGKLPGSTDYARDYFTSQRGETFYLTGFEWAPAGVDVGLFAFEPEALYTNAEGSYAGTYLPDGSFSFEYEGVPGSYGIPKMWYKGYSAQLNGQSLELHKDGAGRVELTIPEGALPGTVVVAYTGTIAQKVSGRFSLGTVILLAALTIVWKKRKQ